MKIDLEKNSIGKHSNPFTVPEGYFDELQINIHKRTRKKQSFFLNSVGSNSLKLALATISLLVIAFLFWPSAEIQSPEDILSEVSDESLMEYLEQNTSIESDDILTYVEYPADSEFEINYSSDQDSIL